MNIETANQVELELDDTETVVEVESKNEEEVVEATTEDQFEKADSATQKRINRLTKKMREAERREAEAVNYAKQVQAESEQLKTRMNNLDTNYVNEFSSRVTTQTKQAQDAMARAMEVGDTKAAVEAQQQLTELAIQNDRAQQAKIQQERYQKQVEAQQQAQVNQPMPQQQPEPKRPDPKAEQWAVKNDWFGQDEAMTYAAF